MEHITDCTGVILCGGKSSRMGFDKALFQVDNEYVVMGTYRKLQTIFSKVLLVTDDSSKFPALFDEIEIVEDNYSEKGPLGGLVTALEMVKTSRLFLLACDMPKVDLVFIQQMALDLHRYDIVICKQNNYLEPLFAFYNTACLSIFKQQLSTDDWRIRKEFDRFSVKNVTLAEELILPNINTPEELVGWDKVYRL